MSRLPSASEITRFHDDCVRAPWTPSRSGSGLMEALWIAIEANHWHNSMLWEQEDLARRRNVPDSEIAGNKRAIDKHNQQRNDAIERADEAFLHLFSGIKGKADARLSSETPGAMIDRLSILALKIHNMRLQTQRTDVDAGHIAACRAKLEKLMEQRGDLAGCLDRLLAELQRGESVFKIYRQFKMYNDPKLNPAIYGEKR
jgi:hypothetical protein